MNGADTFRVRKVRKIKKGNGDHKKGKSHRTRVFSSHKMLLIF